MVYDPTAEKIESTGRIPATIQRHRDDPRLKPESSDSRLDESKTLVFCTSYAATIDAQNASWNSRYLRWLTAIRRSGLIYDQILIVDDGSPVLPAWPSLHILSSLPSQWPDHECVLFHFETNLGRQGVYEYPGWFRSFSFAASYAAFYGFDRVIHIESDAFLISRRIVNYFNSKRQGWTALWSPRYEYPETGIQIITKPEMARFWDFCSRPYIDLCGKPVETIVPFTDIERQFTGDRYGESLSYVPYEADWTMQTYAPSESCDEYYWWMMKERSMNGAAHYLKEVTETSDHRGTDYLSFLRHLNSALCPRTYFEIGTNTGSSLLCFPCDSMCVDPKFLIDQNVLVGRRRASFFQMTSDEFFHTYDFRSFFPGGFDIAFLDGLHLFEALLRDFLNTERYAHRDSIILIHDCLPTNHRMAERTHIIDETEDPSTRASWTGDVWRLLLILKQYRPDLCVRFLDCGPTGLVCCTNLDPHNSTLRDQYDSIVKEFSEVTLESVGLMRLWRMWPMLDSHRLCAEPNAIPAALRGL